jgi:hypothetical protein
MSKDTMEFKEYRISEEYLNELLDYCGRSLVGKLLKRLDIFSDLTIVKKEAKEIIYEEMRALRDLLHAYQMGFEITQYRLQNRENTKDNLTHRQL